ncbi:MAG: hypothetical protein MJZ61_03470 [Bacteroidales bacterium]|nr:hypothetical protein [Bacteroidales bacterium]
MRQTILILLCLLAFAPISNVLGQKFSHKELYDQDFAFTDGLYLTKDDFKNNKPIEKSQINSNIDPTDLSYFEHLVENKRISLFDKVGNEITIESDKVFGFCNDGTVYINYNGTFSRMGIIGSICHFLGTKTIFHNATPYMGMYGYYRPVYHQPTTSQEPQQYFYEFDTGKILEYTSDSMEHLLQADPELHDEFTDLSKKKRNAKLFYYMRKFNEKHPLYVPVYE